MYERSRELLYMLADRARNAPIRRDRTRWKHRSFESFVVHEGRPFLSAKLTVLEEQIARDAVRGVDESTFRIEYKLCFINSQLVQGWDETKKLVYVEGFAWEHWMPHAVHHGWLTINGKVIDVTGPPKRGRLPPAKPPRIFGEFMDRSYIGVPFRRS